eukprot:scaffold14098_cov129-Isochrysis_galbana.AAC.4
MLPAGGRAAPATSHAPPFSRACSLGCFLSLTRRLVLLDRVAFAHIQSRGEPFPGTFPPYALSSLRTFFARAPLNAPRAAAAAAASDSHPRLVRPGRLRHTVPHSRITCLMFARPPWLLLSFLVAACAGVLDVYDPVPRASRRHDMMSWRTNNKQANKSNSIDSWYWYWLLLLLLRLLASVGPGLCS